MRVNDLAFEAWYRGTYGRVLGALIAASGGDEHLAREAADEAFLRAFERWRRVARMGSPEGWVISVGLNRLRRLGRRGSRERALLDRRSTDPLLVDVVSAPSSRALEVWTAVATLPYKYRAVLALRYIADLPEAEVALRMGVPRGTAAAWLSEARRLLPEKLRVADGGADVEGA